ncbi:hypothetical protein RhiJN_06914 [Ceratobasidium sp. AG-Ba]|nr:hypothetical protein RhiJN_06914 [Ceratobasidium sp. AG-Ba]
MQPFDHSILSSLGHSAARPLHRSAALSLWLMVARSLPKPTAPQLDRSLCRPLPNATASKCARFQTRLLPNATTPIETSLGARRTSHACAHSYTGRLLSGATTLAPKPLYLHVQQDAAAVYRSTHW